ncbi:hypothetical protein Tsubulata_026762 [Turnera subulata]|uniref:non-specific serine/threonine protein kinase n=1 Tax=Turnera subulata TaxID=218843 RepID=A0A9Q0G6I2_9ROSI|nr:hypothetical protein Tsubulata_026762 [Turnera subulata]
MRLSIITFLVNFLINLMKKRTMGQVHMLALVCMQFMFLAKICITTTTRSNVTDQEALPALKAAITYDLQNFLTSNWTTNTSFCNWVGITCSNRRERVRELNISGMGLVGTIPPQIGNLSFLWLIDVQKNQLHGYIPPELANLRRMKYLLFSSNNFTDNLITYCPSALHTTIYMEFFQKNICDNLPNLVYLQVSTNQLSGKIPSGIWKCRKLQTLSLSFNYFEGAIPEEVGHLPMLWFLFLGVNNLTGTIPSHVVNVPNLQDLFLQYNNLTGNIPASVFNISTLVRISLDGNRLSGFLPKTIGNLRDLQVLYLQKNFLSNDPSNPELDFFTSLANCRALTRLNLEKNLFNGILPQSIGNLTSNLTDLVMGHNMLVGNIPSELGSLSGLIRLSLSGNNLSGPIPATVARMGNLQFMDLSSNKLNGSIPVDICYARSISEINLEENKLSGALPDCIGLLTSLRNLVLDSNALTSSIPFSLWGLKDLLILSLRFNSIGGSLPLQIGQMEALQQLKLSGNRLFGDISSSLGKLQSLIYLDLANNKFQGAIPESIGNLKDLSLLDLSHNNLSGKIPKSLEELKSLRYLNVSFNKLEGEIPSSGSFRYFTGTSYMGNKALCGPPRLQVPSCGSESHGHSRSTKAILLRFVFPVAASLNMAWTDIKKKKKRRKPTDEMFDGGISLPSWVKASLPSSIMNIVDSNMLNGENQNSVNEQKCLISIMELALQCAHEFPEERSIEKIVSGQQLIQWHPSMIHRNSHNFNPLNGSLPLQVGQMAALRKLNLSGNHLPGNIPFTLGKP